MRRIVFDDYDSVARSGPRICALDQVMAEQGIARKASVQNAEHGLDFVDALARECTFAIQILIDIGNRAGVGIETCLASKDGG